MTSCEEQINYLSTSADEMKNVEGILNRGEEELKIKQLTDKIQKVISRKTEAINKHRQKLKMLTDENARLKGIVS